MKSSWKFVTTVVLGAVIAFGMIAPGLQATVAAAKFELPFDAQWGKVDLPTGAYTFSVDHFASNGLIRIYQGTKVVGTLHPVTFEVNEGHGKKPALICIRNDGKVTVRALRLPNVGTFYFPLPKKLKVLVAQQPELIETVMVEVSGN